MPAIIFNIAFTTPDPPKTASPRQCAEHAAQRSYYNWTAQYNYKAYMEDKIKTQVHKDYSDYMEKGGALFDQNGVINEKKLDEIKQRLSTTRSIIWHGFISFEEAYKSQFDTKEKCSDFLHDTFNVLIDNSHLDRDNIDLVAALHNDTEHHYHIHFTFFEREAKHKNNTYTRKGKFSQRAIDNFVVSSNLYLDERRQQLHVERDRLIDRIRSVYPTARAAEFNREDNNVVAKAVTALADKLPETGRLGYDSDNMKVLRPQIDNVVNLMIANDKTLCSAYVDWKNEVSRREKIARAAMTESRFAYVDGKRLTIDTTTGSTVVRNWDNVRVIDDVKRDMRVRLGNYAIKFALQTKRARAKLNYSGKPTREGKINARKARNQISRGIRDICIAMTTCVNNGHVDFTKELRRAEYEIQTGRQVSHGKN